MAVAAGIAAGGSLLAGGLNFLGGQSANRRSHRMAREQMDFQERMSSTAYQRAVQDMEQAGINPMLAYTQGGASTPGGAMGQSSNVLGAGVSSAMEARRMFAEVKNMQETNKKLMAETSLTRTLERQAEALTKQYINSAKALDLQMPKLENQAEVEKDIKGGPLPYFRALTGLGLGNLFK